MSRRCLRGLLQFILPFRIIACVLDGVAFLLVVIVELVLLLLIRQRIRRLLVAHLIARKLVKIVAVSQPAVVVVVLKADERIQVGAVSIQAVLIHAIGKLL